MASMAAAADCGGVDWSEPVAVASVLALALLNTVVVTGNGLVIAAVLTSPPLRTTTHLFIGSLAAADLLVGLLVLPFSASLQLTGSWLFGPTWCSVWLATDVWCCTASILNLCAISLDRFLAVTRPVNYPSLMSTRRARALVAAVWFVAFIIALPPLMGQKEGGDGPPDALCPVTECRLISERGYVVYSAVGSFFLPCLIMLFFYWRIYRAAASTTRSINKGFKTIDRESHRSRTSKERVTLRIHRGRGSTYGTAGVSVMEPPEERRSHSAQDLLRPPSRAQRSPSPSPRRRLPVANGRVPSAARSRDASPLGRAGPDRSMAQLLPPSERSPLPPSERSPPPPALRRVRSDRAMPRVPAAGPHHARSPQRRLPPPRLTTAASSRSPSPSTVSSGSRLLPPVPTHHVSSPATSAPSSPGGGESPDSRRRVGVNKLNLKAHAKRFRVETKAAKTLAVLIGVFVLCWLPFFTLYLVRPFCESCFSDTVFTLCFWLGYCNSAINPALYACFSHDFRTAFKRILRRISCCCWTTTKQESAVIVSFHAYGEESQPSSNCLGGEPV